MEERTRSTTTLLILGALLSTVSCAVPAFEVGSGGNSNSTGGAGAAGGSGGQGGDGPSYCADFDWQDATCAACIEASCCEAAHVCRGDESCATLYDCQARCGEGDTECRAACAISEHDAFKAADQTLSACVSANCRDACVPCGGMVQGYMPTCTTCVESNCCEEASACADDPECAALSKCKGDNLLLLSICGDGSQSVASKSKRQDLVTCFSKRCPDACYGENWTCEIDDSVYLSPAERYATVAVMAVNPTTPGCLQAAGQYVPGIGFAGSFNVPPGCLYPGSVVKACFKNDELCADPYATATTQENGAATLTDVPLDDGGIFEGYFEITGGGVWSSVVYRQHDVQLVLFSGPVPIAPSDLDLAANTGIEIASEDGKGHIFVTIRDCTHALARGVRFEVVGLPAWDGYYTEDGNPVTILDETVDGQATLLNIPVGSHEIRAIHAGTGDVVSTQIVRVREDWLTVVELGANRAD